MYPFEIRPSQRPSKPSQDTPVHLSAPSSHMAARNYKRPVMHDKALVNPAIVSQCLYPCHATASLKDPACIPARSHRGLCNLTRTSKDLGNTGGAGVPSGPLSSIPLAQHCKTRQSVVTAAKEVPAWLISMEVQCRGWNDCRAASVAYWHTGLPSLMCLGHRVL